MADLKAGTTVGGNLVWHQGNFPLDNVTGHLYFDSYLVYSELDKPKAIDNDFVSKADGGAYLKSVDFNEGLNILDTTGYKITIGKNAAGSSPMYAYTASMKIKGTYAYETENGQPFILFNPTLDVNENRLTVMGNILGRHLRDETGRVFSPGNPPTPTDVSLGNVTNDAQVKVSFTGLQTMTGPLAAPNLISLNPATSAQHVPRLDQVVVKGTIIDFGTF